MKRILSLAAAALAGTVLLPATAGAGSHNKPPGRDLTIDAQPNPVTFGRSTLVSGQLKGRDNSGQTIELHRDEHPFEGAFALTATTTTDARGDYALRVFPAVSTRYRTESRSPGRPVSDVETVAVAMLVSFRVSDPTPRAGQRVRFSGRACPEHDGRTVHIQRRGSDGRYRHVAHTALRDEQGGPTVLGRPCSTYARTLRVNRDGVFRTAVAGDGDHASGRSRARSLDAHR